MVKSLNSLSLLGLKGWFYPVAAMHQQFVVTGSGGVGVGGCDGCRVYIFGCECIHWKSALVLIVVHQDSPINPDLNPHVFLCECISTFIQTLLCTDSEETN